jgi:hypothetical protein
MSLSLDILLVLGLALICLLWLSWDFRQRVLGSQERRSYSEPFDAHRVTHRLGDVRRDFADVAHTRRRYSGFHAELLASTRKAVADLPFFRAR